MAMVALLIAEPAPSEPISRLPSRTLLLLAASWCAPCYKELGMIDAIAAEARPFEVRVLMVEDGRRARALTRRIDDRYLWKPPGDVLQQARADLLGRTAGLPYSVVVDEEGRICADEKGGLDAARARALVGRCRP